MIKSHVIHLFASGFHMYPISSISTAVNDGSKTKIHCICVFLFSFDLVGEPLLLGTMLYANSQVASKLQITYVKKMKFRITYEKVKSRILISISTSLKTKISSLPPQLRTVVNRLPVFWEYIVVPSPWYSWLLSGYFTTC